MTQATMPPSCPRVPEAGAYLLGALAPAERTDYAAHLAGCSQCQREVSELAGLPGLLARAPASASEPVRELAGEPAVEPPAPDPVPGALRSVYRHRMRRRLLTAAAVVLIAGGAFGGALAFNREASPAPAVALPVVLQPVGGTPVTATAGLTDTSWGTVIRMRCRFGESVADHSVVVVLVARGADGTGEELARWTVHPGDEVNITSATDLRGAQLAALEVRTTKGTTVLRTEQL